MTTNAAQRLFLIAAIILTSYCGVLFLVTRERANAEASKEHLSVSSRKVRVCIQSGLLAPCIEYRFESEETRTEPVYLPYIRYSLFGDVVEDRLK